MPRKAKAVIVAAARATKRTNGDDQEIGTRLKLARVAKNMSQEELGLSLGLTFQQIQKYEKGSNRLSGSRILNICRTLEITPHQLLGWQEPETAALIEADVYKMARKLMAIRPELRAITMRLIMTVSEMAEAGTT